MSIFEQFKHEDSFMQMTMSEKLIGTLYTILLGMAVTVVALIIIMYLTKFMSLVIRRLEKKTVAPVVKAPVVETKPVIAPVVDENDDEELIAVITAAVAASLNTSMHNIVVTNITRVSDSTPTWGKIGRSDVMSSRM